MPERSFYDEDSINNRRKRFQRRRRYQADLKTMIANGVYGMSAITALTAQNTTGVQGIFEVTPEFLEQQIDSVFTDIRPDAVKIGMVSSAGLIKSIAKKLHEHKAENIVVDPVMVATKRIKADQRRCHRHIKGIPVSDGGSPDPEYPGDRGFIRDGSKVR